MKNLLSCLILVGALTGQVCCSDEPITQSVELSLAAVSVSGHHEYMLISDTLDFKIFIKEMAEDRLVISIEKHNQNWVFIDTVEGGATLACSVLDLQSDGVPEVRLQFGTNWTWSFYYSVTPRGVFRLKADHPIHELHCLDTPYYYDTFSESCYGDNTISSLLILTGDTLLTQSKVYHINCDGGSELWLVEDDSVELKESYFSEDSAAFFWSSYLLKKDKKNGRLFEPPVLY